jgi:hypothetical protein
VTHFHSLKAAPGCKRKSEGQSGAIAPSQTQAVLFVMLTLFPIAWSVSEYVFGVRTSKLTRHLGSKSLSTYSKEYVKQTRHYPSDFLVLSLCFRKRNVYRYGPGEVIISEFFSDAYAMVGLCTLNQVDP